MFIFMSMELRYLIKQLKVPQDQGSQMCQIIFSLESLMMRHRLTAPSMKSKSTTTSVQPPRSKPILPPAGRPKAPPPNSALTTNGSPTASSATGRWMKQLLHPLILRVMAEAVPGEETQHQVPVNSAMPSLLTEREIIYKLRTTTLLTLLKLSR